MCQVCHDYHSILDSKLDKMADDHDLIRRDLEVHIAEAHAHLVTGAEIQGWDSEILEQVNKLADAVMGPRYQDFDDVTHRDGDDGLVHKVDANTALLLDLREHQIRNGDRVRIQFGAKEWSGIIVALVSLLGTIIITVG